MSYGSSDRDEVRERRSRSSPRPRPSGRRRSRRRACWRPCRRRGRPGPSSRRRRRSSRAPRRRDRRTPGCACRRRGRSRCPFARFASAYERAATACAFSASGDQADGISDGTTPFRYASRPSDVDHLERLPVAEHADLAAVRLAVDDERLLRREGQRRRQRLARHRELRLQDERARVERHLATRRVGHGPGDDRVERRLLALGEQDADGRDLRRAERRARCSSGRGSGRTSSRASRSRTRPTG